MTRLDVSPIILKECMVADERFPLRLDLWRINRHHMGYWTGYVRTYA